MPRTSFALILALLFPSARAVEFTSPRIQAITSWIGNSYGGGTKWVQQDIAALTVMSDGTVFTNVEWDEAGGNVGEYRDGELIRHALHTHGWGNNGGKAVAANSRYLYFGMEVGNEGGGLQDPETWPEKGKKWLGISRRPRADIAAAAPFAGGKGGKGGTLTGAFLVVAEITQETKMALPGICADELRLFVADPRESRLKIYNAETMQPLGSTEIDGAGPLVMDRGLVWMLEAAGGLRPGGRMQRFNLQGEPAGPPLKLPEGISPAAFCFDSAGRLLIADGGESQQIHFFTVKGDELLEAGTFGKKGGIAAGIPGATGDKKLNGVTAIGCDAKDRLYVAHDAQSGGGGTVLESYGLADGELKWRLFGLTFVDMGDVDAADDKEVFTKEERFHLDYDKPAGSEAEYAAYTIARAKYPQDPRLHIWSAGAWVRQIGGKRVLFVNDMNGEHLQVYRFMPGSEVAIPSGFFAKKKVSPAAKEQDAWPPHQPEKGAWLWRDVDGDGAFDEDEYQVADGAEIPASQGWWVDRAGNVWLATETRGIRCYLSAGLDAKGNPQWDFKSPKIFPHPEGFREVKRLRYDPDSDVMYLGGTTEEEKNQHWKPMGPVLARYDGWLRGVPKQAWRVTLPYAKGSSGHESCEPMGFDLAGDFLFVPYTGSSKPDGVMTGHVEIFRSADGSPVGHVEPGPEVGEIGLQDIRETLAAHRRKDGEYIVLLEDDFKAKVVMFRVKGLE